MHSLLVSGFKMKNNSREVVVCTGDAHLKPTEQGRRRCARDKIYKDLLSVIYFLHMEPTCQCFQYLSKYHQEIWLSVYESLLGHFTSKP